MVRRRKFSDEYKREAVRLATHPGVTKSQVAQELGINANLLGRWCRDYAANGAAAFPRQDRFDHLVWRLRQNGPTARKEPRLPFTTKPLRWPQGD